MEFTDFVWYLIMQKGRTTSMELDEYLKNKNGTYKISITKQAFSKQRRNLKPQIFIDIYKDYLMDFYHNYPEEINTFKGYNICAIDGSLFEIPNTKELREEYIIIFDRGYPGIDLIWYLEKLKIKYIFRLQTKMYEKEKKSMKTEDEWIELNVAGDILKNKLHLENFTGKTKITIEQDFYAQIYTFNVLQDIKNTNTRRIQGK